ncbi:MAG: hypothetical protein IT303_08725, partial [Dehalococcoidia bacterium]|nr:hypothetical protein [Dehalococcoidia bacterium]
MKTVDGTDDGTMFAFTGLGGGFSLAGGGSTTFDELAPGYYTITEMKADGWQLLSFGCTLEGAMTARSAAPAGGTSVDLQAGQHWICNFVNAPVETEPETASLTIVKELVNDGPGTAVESDFIISVSQGGSVVQSGAGSATGVTYDLPAGDYVVSEGPHPGYESSIRGACDGDGSVTLVAGESYTCVVRNDDSGSTGNASLTIIKELVNDDDGIAAEGDFTISVSRGGTEVESDSGSATGVTYSLPAGDYVVAEGPHPGYESSIRGACDGDGTVTLAAGESYTCTVRNDDIAASEETGTLTVIKEVVNDDEGVSVAGDFMISVMSGGTDVAGSPAAGSDTGTAYTLDAGTYTVSEGFYTGYTTAFAGDCAADGTVNMTAGADLTCTVVNDDTDAVEVLGSITVTKTVPDGEDDGTDFGFTSTVTGSETFALDVDTDATLGNSSTFGPLTPGLYTFTEADVAGWDLDSIVCTGSAAAPLVDGSSVTIDIATDEVVNCTFHNMPEAVTEQPGFVKVRKIVTGDGAPAGDTFTVNIGDNMGIPVAAGADTTEYSFDADETVVVTEDITPGYVLQGWSLTQGVVE